MSRVGYFFWGHLADVKVHGGVAVNAPDGNAFYSWSIIKELQKRGHEVVRLAPDRDREAVSNQGRRAFGAFANNDRFESYRDMLGYNSVDIKELDYIIMEWRWPIPGRNTVEDIGIIDFQPDLVLMATLLTEASDVPVVVLDLDYKMDSDLLVAWVLELGWSRGEHHHVEAPFDFSHINDFEITKLHYDVPTITYIGNRYERDWAIDKYLTGASGIDIDVYGNWLAGQRNSDRRWPHITFHPQAQISQFRHIYQQASVSPLLLKQEYCDNGFMTARILECVFFGAIPAIIEEFRSPIEYTPFPELVIHSAEELNELARRANVDFDWRKKVIEGLREHLRFMDASHFIDKVEKHEV